MGQYVCGWVALVTLAVKSDSANCMTCYFALDSDALHSISAARDRPPTLLGNSCVLACWRVRRSYGGICVTYESFEMAEREMVVVTGSLSTCS